MQTYYHKCQLLIFTTALLTFSACESNPSHRPPIGGTIMLMDNEKKGLCFLPNFETAYLTSTEKYNDLNFLSDLSPYKRNHISSDKVREILDKIKDEVDFFTSKKYKATKCNA